MLRKGRSTNEIKKKILKKRILARRSNQIVQVISNKDFCLDRDSNLMGNEKKLGEG